jgi:hypothetical protein
MQHDYDITTADANTGATVRAAINAALKALATLNEGADEPTTTFPNMLWPDLTNNLLKRRNPANTAWITMGTLSDIYLGLAATFAENSFTQSQQIEGDALLLRLNDTGASGEEWAVRSDGGNLEIVLNTGTESAPVWTVQARIDVNALRIGNGTSADIDIVANNDAGNKPRLRYQAAGSKWQYSNDGVTFYDIGGGAGTGLPTGGTTGQVLAKTTGADYDAGWITPANTGKLQRQVFTGSGTFTFPAGTTPSTVFKFTITGGGAGSYWGTGNYCVGGGAGATAMVWLSGFAAGQYINVTVGAGGGYATHGGASSISSGTAAITSVSAGGGLHTGAGGNASNGDINIPGGNGRGIGNYEQGLIGGDSFYGSSPAFGAGGNYNSVDPIGRPGGQGIVIVEWVL